MAIVRLEQLYPLRDEQLGDGPGALSADGTPVVWVQEEPENMGAWRYLRARFGERLLGARPLLGRLPAGVGQPGDRLGEPPQDRAGAAPERLALKAATLSMAVELKFRPSASRSPKCRSATGSRREGRPVEQDEPLVVIETDKATVELPAPVAGVLARILKQKGETARVGEVIGTWRRPRRRRRPPPRRRPPRPARHEPAPASEAGSSGDAARVMPAAGRLLAEHGVQAEQVTPTGPGGRLLKEDVLRHLEEAAVPKAAPPPEGAPGKSAPEPEVATPRTAEGREEEMVPMSLLRRRIAERLVEAQQTAALLTTFNEIDMSAVMALRTGAPGGVPAAIQASSSASCRSSSRRRSRR